MRLEPDTDALRAEVARLSRPHPSGGRVVERAAILAAGADGAALLAWITEHGGQPEALAPADGQQGLHGDRRQGTGDVRRPLRYVIPAAALAPPGP